MIGGTPSESAVAPYAVERELLGMRVGEKKTVRLYPYEAYGYFDQSKLLEMDKEEFIRDSGIENLEEGQTYQLGTLVFTIYEVTEDKVKLDFNHRFAVIANEVVIPREEFEKTAQVYVGNEVSYQGQRAIVIQFTDTEVILDVNPSVFEFVVEVIQIKKV
jgi:FKBP-type peptidyl-prolyl cis-trans isomerase 2